MTEEKIRDRVRKLLRLAADAGATENEKAVAMQKASQLIEEHNIVLGQESDYAENIRVIKGSMFATGMKLPYHRVIAYAVATLYDCQSMYFKDQGGHSYWGMSHQVEAAEETFVWIVAQVEDLYRIALKAFDGNLSKQQRAELRASFKDAAAARIGQRVHRIIHERTVNRDSRALVVVDTAKAKIAEMNEAGKIKVSKAVQLRDGFGTGAGYNAGGLVKIQKEVRA